MNINTQKAAHWFGWVVLVLGIAGFIPGIVNTQGLLLGIFQVDALHNLAHILVGLAALFSVGSVASSKMYFKVVGVILAILTILGFVGGTTILNIILTNTASNVLHLVATLYALYYGFRKEVTMTM